MFTSNDIIAAYTRAAAIADGVLTDVTAIAREINPHALPTVLSQDVAGRVEDAPDNIAFPDTFRRRACHLLMKCEIVRASRVDCYEEVTANLPGTGLYTCWLHVGPGDNGEPVTTIIQPHER